MTKYKTKRRRARRRDGFLERYRLEDTYLLRPDRANGRPGIYGGYSPEGNPVLIKVWPRTPTSADNDLQDIWRHELRQLHRMAGYPGATGSIALLYDAGYDAQGFYLVLSTGLRRPLHTIHSNASPGHWIRQPRQSTNRATIWRNLALLAKGVETLHSQGLLHRNLDDWAILTAGTEDPDFQLTGFEWSMRIPAAETGGRSRSGHNQDSFLRDWAMYGSVSAKLLDASLERLQDLSIAPYEVADHLSSQEVLLLRDLLQGPADAILDGEAVASRIGQITRSLTAELAHKSPKWHIAVNIGAGTRLADRIRAVTDRDIESDDSAAQLSFILADLGRAPLLIAVHRPDNPGSFRLLLRGHNLIYRIQEFPASARGNPTWDIAYCEDVSDHGPAPVNLVGERILDASELEIMPLAVAIERYPRMRGKLRSWEEWRREFSAESSRPTPQQITHQALSLIQFLEALYAVANTFPVEVLTPRTDDRDALDEDCVLRIRSRRESDRDELARSLKMRPPALRLDEELTGERVRPEGWILSSSRSLGEQNPGDTEWQFQYAERPDTGPAEYIFSGPRPPAMLREAFLIPEGSVGLDVQFRRRLKALKALADHEELLRMMTDARDRIVDSHDIFTEDEAFAKLDEPKQNALRELTATLPIFLVQGPPGVGKTRLVRDFVRRRFADEPTSRVLIAAQSNAAVDHLMDELGAILEKDEKDGPLVVRCSSRDGPEIPSRFDIRLQSKELIGRLAKSALAKELPSGLRNALDILAAQAVLTDTSKGTWTQSKRTIFGRSPAQAFRAFEGAVARAANVVFATTNSGELERLIDERGQCDWAIVEEAGKATGSELVSPLLLSHRRLMIGDHKQLPPFGADQLAELLKTPEAVRESLLLGDEFVSRRMRGDAADEIIDEIDEEKEVPDDALPRLCAEALRLLTYFESAIETEFSRQSARRAGKPIAAKLTQQHRMHPTIARLVSRCFYNGALTTHPSCAERFQAGPRPFITLDPRRLPPSPIVVIDMPYGQAHLGSQHGEKRPRWNNPMECQAVAQVIRLLEPLPSAEKKPTLAILSPYSQQVRRLTDLTADIPNIGRFEPPSHNGRFCHTVDSFQGSEADVVVISLVRNNEHSNVRSALGFLSDIRRMNVLLSRARWQLVLVASLSFLREVLNSLAGKQVESSVQFLDEMLREIDESSSRGDASIVPYSALDGARK